MVPSFLKLFPQGDQLKIRLTNLTFPKIGNRTEFLSFGGIFRNREKGLAKRMPDQNDADSVCYNLFAHYSVYRVTRDAVPARVPSPFNQHPNR